MIPSFFLSAQGFVKNKRLAVEVRAIQAETDERCMTLAQAEAGAESSAGKYLRCRVLAPVNVGSGLRR